jgi:hypothetical protein
MITFLGYLTLLFGGGVACGLLTFWGLAWLGRGGVETIWRDLVICACVALGWVAATGIAALLGAL